MNLVSPHFCAKDYMSLVKAKLFFYNLYVSVSLN